MGDSLEEKLKGHVQHLAGDIGERNVFSPASLESAANYIESELAAMGHAVKRQTYVAKGVECSNLEVVLTGQTWPQQSIVIGAHYDTVSGSPGADDNASAVAALMEIARSLAGLKPGRTIKLVAFTNEEHPFFFWGDMGSQIYAVEARKRNEDILLMISLEMLGYYRDEPGSQRYPPLFKNFHPDRGNFIAFVSNISSTFALRRAAKAFRRRSDFPLETTSTFGWIPGISWSDQLSFWRQGYRAMMCTDTAFFRNPNYHRPEDKPDTLDYSRLAKVTAGLAEMCKELGDCQSF